jgi:hypothetical protein
MTHPIAIFPQVSGEATFIGKVAFDTFVVGFGTYLFFKPKWWYIAIGSGSAITGATIYAMYKPKWSIGVFVSSAIACMIVLGFSLYILLRIWKETLKEKRCKRR